MGAPVAANGFFFFFTITALYHKYHPYLNLGKIDFMSLFILQLKSAALLHHADMQYGGVKTSP